MLVAPRLAGIYTVDIVSGNCGIVSNLIVTGFLLNLRRPVGTIPFGRHRAGEKQAAAALFSLGNGYP